MAVPLSPLNKREVLKTPYILIWSVVVVISAFSSIGGACL